MPKKPKKLSKIDSIAQNLYELRMELDAFRDGLCPLTALEFARLQLHLTRLFRAHARATSALSPSTVSEIFDQELRK